MFRRITPFLLSLLLICAAAVAQVPGTLTGQVFDENGDPIAEVKITITDPEAATFLQEEMTDKRGKFSIRVNNSVPRYYFKLEKEGFQSMIVPEVKIPGRARTRRDFDLISAAAALAARDPEEIEKGNYVKLYNQGVSALEAQSFGLAKSLFEGALEKKADYGPAHGGLARVYWKQEDWENALSSAQRSVELNPDDTEIQQVLYAAYNGLGQTDKAKAILAEMQASDPAKAGLNMFNEAADLYNNGQLAEAKGMFEQILAVQPDHAKTHYMLGLCYVSEGANAEAKEHLNRFLELDPEDPDAATAQEMLKYVE